MADKNYEIKFSLSDGTEKTVGFTAPQGDPGADGKSAYEYAQDGGYTGTEEEFAAKLAAEGEGGSGSAEGAVLYTEQTLDDDQKVQARTNIGAQAELTFDTAPTSGSTNPVTSGGVSTALNNLEESIASASAAHNSGALLWDGVIGDREYVVMSGDVSTTCTVLVHITEEIPDVTIPFAAISLSQYGIYNVGLTTEISMESDGFGGVGQYVYIVPYDDYVLGEYTFPKKGVYFLAQVQAVDDGVPFVLMGAFSLKIAGYSFAEDGSDYFENGTKTVFGDTLTWDGNTEGLELNVDNATGMYYCVVSNVTPNLDDFANGATVTVYSLTDDTEVSGEVYAKLNDDGDAIYLLEAGGEGILPAVVIVPGVSCAFMGITDSTYVKSLTIPGYTGFPAEAEAVLLKEKHIPDTVCMHGDKELILTSSTAGSTKQFKITVDDDGALTATEYTTEVSE